ncbi:type IV secretory system conjugative DNA transfer family protein [Virgibacillus proomii]|nr:type IV secretory system conjugative DNA transfer family protein [Virgibacillus proomii]MBU5267378.1 type IV secretory system conjugative DNA transfer family protein [Virgibacillus proomii]
MYSVANLLSTLGSQEDAQGNNELDNYFKQRPDQNPAKIMYATSEFAEGKTRSSIFSIAMEKLQIFTLEPNARLTSYNSLEFTDVGFGEKPVAIFMVTPDYDTSNHALASIFVSQLYRANAEKATMQSGKMKRHVHFMLDEFGNMPAIEGMAGMVTVGAGRGFRYHLIVQSYSQVKSQYGEDESDTIIGNCSNQIYILTQDLDTAEHYSSLLGDKTITDISRTGNLLSTDKSHSESTKERPLLFADELLQLREGESVVIRVNKRQDMKRHKIIPKPIFNSLESKTYHKFRYQYLDDDFDTSTSVLTLPINSNKFHDIILEDIVFTSTFKDEDQYVPIGKLADNKTINRIKRMFSNLNGKYNYDDINDWSLLHLFSHLVYDIRLENDYYKDVIRMFKNIVSEKYLDFWWDKQQVVIRELGALVEVPPRPKMPFKR